MFEKLYDHDIAPVSFHGYVMRLQMLRVQTKRCSNVKFIVFLLYCQSQNRMPYTDVFGTLANSASRNKTCHSM